MHIIRILTSSQTISKSQSCIHFLLYCMLLILFIQDIYWTAPLFAMLGRHQDIFDLFLKFKGKLNLDHKDIVSSTNG